MKSRLFEWRLIGRNQRTSLMASAQYKVVGVPQPPWANLSGVPAALVESAIHLILVVQGGSISKDQSFGGVREALLITLMKSLACLW